MTIHAHTDQGTSCPAYINISERVSNPGDVIVTVRSAGENNASAIILSRDKLRDLSNDVRKHLGDARANWSGVNLDFGTALLALKDGKRVARAGWNGKGMFVYLVPANAYPAQTGAAKAHFGEGALVPYNDYLALKGADDTVSTWAPSGSDALAEDWLTVE